MEKANLINQIRDISPNTRGGRLKINILSGFAVKGGNMVLSFVLIPLILAYLTSYKYGIWLTINSVISWFSTMDIGLSGGLRLKLQESLTKKDIKTSKTLVSTTYVMLFLISISLVIILCGIIIFSNIDFASFFKVEESFNSELRQVLLITVACFFVRFTLQPISSILAADQLDFVQSIMLLTENLWNLLGIYLLSVFSKESLLLASLVFSVTPIINLLLFNLFFFNKKYKSIRPNIRYFSKSCVKSLFGVGVDIFITSIAMIFIIQCNNILIVRFYTPTDVTIYNLVVKLFATISVLYTLIVSPMWSAFGNAFANNDLEWVSRTFAKMSKLLYGAALLYGLLIIIAPFIFKIWASMDIHDYLLISCCGVYYIIQNIESTYVYLFNGSGRREYIKLQRNMMIFGALVNIPLVILFSGYLGFGLYSIFIANLTALLPRVLIYRFQGRRLLKTM